MAPVLPTVEQCRAFMAKINVGRRAFGLESLERLDYDACTPSDPQGCLSHHHLMEQISNDGETTNYYFHFEEGEQVEAQRLATAFGVEAGASVKDSCTCEECLHNRPLSVPIPEEIRMVTDPFDRCAQGLRERLVEAELVTA